ncbi:MAG TPA: 4Fe-4S dicluster domain-containing protein [Bacteroidales bacterium]|nr:4Fe-4S dicluster domain-containing protein [Bacteroidales bacterium]HPT02245.1 4Fe-4S dicluster domain-containing protein [Bacteroidales bacterium]
MSDIKEKVRFGFTVNKDRQIDYDANSKKLASTVIIAEPSLNLCISCGTCAATCTAAQFTDFSLRRLILLVRRGEVSGLENEVTKCMLCGKCQLVCPRGVNTRNLILQIHKALKNTVL